MKKLIFTFIFIPFCASSFAQVIHEGFMSENSFFDLEEVLENMDAVYDLVLTDKELTVISADITQFKNLRNLDVSSNQLTTIPAEIGNLEDLLLLDLTGNQLTTFR